MLTKRYRYNDLDWLAFHCIALNSINHIAITLHIITYIDICICQFGRSHCHSHDVAAAHQKKPQSQRQDGTPQKGKDLPKKRLQSLRTWLAPIRNVSLPKALLGFLLRAQTPSRKIYNTYNTSTSTMWMQNRSNSRCILVLWSNSIAVIPPDIFFCFRGLVCHHESLVKCYLCTSRPLQFVEKPRS